MSFRMTLTDSLTGSSLVIDSPAELTAETAADALTQADSELIDGPLSPAVCRAFIKPLDQGLSGHAVILERESFLYVGLAYTKFDPSHRPPGVTEWIVL